MFDDYRKSKGDKLLYCSFCGKSERDVCKLIAGPSVFVCDECVELCNDIIREESEELKDKTWEKVVLPPLDTLADAISKLGQEENTGIVLVVGKDRKLLGTITDGDVRRARVANKGMCSRLKNVMNSNPVVVQDESKLPVIQKLCKAGNVTKLPILDQRHRVVGLVAVYGEEKNRERDIVLIVDDEPDIRSVVSEILRNEGLEVETAENVDVAREKFNKLTPDLVLVHIGMSDTDGMTLLKEWKTAENAPPIVITSAYSTVKTVVEYVRAGAYDFIEKPFSTEKLLTTVREALKSHT